MAVFFFPNWSFIISEKCMVTPKFSVLDTKGTSIAKFCFLRIVLNRAKNIPVLVGTTHRKPEYLEMRRTYAQ